MFNSARISSEPPPIEHYVARHYSHRDSMHGLDHVRRIARAAGWLLEHYPQADRDAVICAAYLHGLVEGQAEEAVKCLEQMEVSPKRRDLIFEIARQSHKEAKPDTLEAHILRDAHLIEGGPTFHLVKCLVTGAERGQSLERTIEIMERDILGRFACHLPEAQMLYEEKERFAREALASIKAHI